MWWCVPVLRVGRQGQQESSGAHWPASVGKSAHSRLREKSCLKKYDGEINRGRQYLPLASNTCAHTCMHIFYTHHMNTYIHKGTQKKVGYLLWPYTQWWSKLLVIGLDLPTSTQDVGEGRGGTTRDIYCSCPDWSFLFYTLSFYSLKNNLALLLGGVCVCIHPRELWKLKSPRI